MTPEGRVKAAINRTLDAYKSSYKYMPVPSGYGMSTLDYVLCVNGRFIAIEAKAPGKKLTARQIKIMRQIERAGGTVFVIDNVDGCGPLKEHLEKVTNAPHPNQCQT